MKTLSATIEINPALVPALRISETLPSDLEHASGNLHALQDKTQQAVGYLVEKTDPDDAWDALEPRFFVTPSFREALDLVQMKFADLPARET